MPNVAAFHRRNWEFSQTAEFTAWMWHILRSSAVRVMRIHVAGDFYSPDYTEQWLSIVTRSPHIQFFAYTRSWRSSPILPTLIALGQLRNCSLWFSLDRETGSPPLVAGIRRAYMAIDDVDASSAPDDCDLVFRDRPLTPMKKANGVLVCPPENGVKGILRHTCTTCGVCWDKLRRPHWEVAIGSLLHDDEGVAIHAPAL